MKVWYRCKTSFIPLLSATGLVLTLSLGFAISANAQQPYKIRKVVLDAGHGGKDPGCHGNNSREKEVALAIVLDLGKKLKATYPEIEVIYTRDTDVFIPLNERAAIANRNKADLFISVHCNYISVRNRATGSETYVLGLHRAEDNLDVAKRENAAILLEDNYEKTYEGFDPYSAEGHIILSMFQNAHLEQSIAFATYVQSAFKKAASIPSRGVKQAGFLVLRETTMPSVLIETGFLSTDADENYLVKKENQQQVASNILQAFGQFKKEMEDYLDPSLASLEGEKITAEEKTISTKSPEAVNPAKSPDKTIPAKSVETAPPDKTSMVPNDQLTGAVTYRIQIAASSKSAVDSRYQAIEDLEIIKEDDLYKFLVGHYTSPEAARPRLSTLKESGFQGAFIVAYKDGRRVRA